MFRELKKLEDKYRLLTRPSRDPANLTNSQKIREISKERAELEPVIRKYEELQKVGAGQGGLPEDPDATRPPTPNLKAWPKGRSRPSKSAKSPSRSSSSVLLLPKDPFDDKNVLLEVRAGAGGDEASLFAQDLFRMYSRYAENKGWKFEVLDVSPSPIGGIKEAVASIRGRRVYSALKYESGVHRVQRVPKTEAGGRIHTSTATVAVLPEADEIDVRIDPKDLKIEAFGASGPGGQNVNRNYTAIRVTHKPSGLVVSCQDEKSQHRNKEKAMRILRSRLMDAAQSEQQQRIAKDRRSKVGTGERSEKIRTYNFPQSRITDHRLNESFHRMEAILDGDLDALTEALTLRSQTPAGGGGGADGDPGDDLET